MTGDVTTEIRLAELIWRTIKIRVLLLLVTIGVILVIWSALESGHQKLVQIDAEFREQEISQMRSSGVKEEVLKPLESAASSEALPEAERRMDSLLLAVIGTDEDSAKASQYIQARLSRVDEYDQKRNDAFQIEFNVPYLKSSVTLNALTLSDAWPFCVMVMLLVTITLGFQQRSYEVILSLERSKSTTIREKARSLALTEFFAGTLSRSRVRRQEVWMYKRRVILYPESIVTGSMLAAIVWLSLELLAAYNPTFRHPTSSILFGYYSVAWAALVLSTVLVIKTRSYYADELAQAMEFPVRSDRLWFIHKLGEQTEAISGRIGLPSAKLHDVLCVILGLLGLVSVFSRWTVPISIAGYQFLRSQPPSQSGGGISFFRIDPPLFLQMRILVTFALLFIIFSLCVIGGRRYVKPRARALLDSIRSWMSYALLYLAGNFMIYLGVLEYESGTDNPLPFLDMVFSPRGLTAPRRMPLLFYNPTWKFFVFFFCSVALSLANLAAKRDRATAAVGARDERSNS